MTENYVKKSNVILRIIPIIACVYMIEVSLSRIRNRYRYKRLVDNIISLYSKNRLSK